jgi:hypothetical protein
MLTILLLILIIMALGGGGYSMVGAGNAVGGYSLFGVILIVLVVFFLFGHRF